jgi:hypothetical protein
MAVENRLYSLVRQEIPEHREIAKRDVLELHYIEIECKGDADESLLNNFFKDFSPAARQDWIRDILGGNAVVKLDYFAGVYSNREMPETGTIDKYEQTLNHSGRPTYAVHIWGQWVRTETVAPTKTSSNQIVTLHITDSRGKQPEIEKDCYPLMIGRSGSSTIIVKGTFVSNDHCVLYAEQGRFWLEDISRNGTWLDGQKLPSRQRIELSPSRHRLRLGKASGEAKDCPEIKLEFLASSITPVASATPVYQANATAVIGAEDKLLAVLQIQDATGKPQCDVMSLPFTIGRASDRHYVTPPTHAGTSGKHMIIEAINETGASVINEAHEKNGIALKGELQPARFIWPFDSEIVLAPQWKRDPPVRIVLKRPK